jgi:hypothetical protein
MSLRTKSDNDGKGPIVSVGVTAHVALLVGGVVVAGGVVVVVVVAAVVPVAVVEVGAVGESLPQADDHAAPATVRIPRASRRLHRLLFVLSDIFSRAPNGTVKRDRAGRQQHRCRDSPGAGPGVTTAATPASVDARRPPG